MPMVGKVHTFGDATTAGVELSVETKALNRPSVLAGVFMERSAATAITIAIGLITEWGTFTFDSEAAVTASQWVRVPNFPLAAGMKVTLTTTGIGGAETAAGFIQIEEMAQ
jgi:hypothetical protein